MIEIAVHEIANYDMVQVLQKAEQGEKVALVYDGKWFDIKLSETQKQIERELAFDEFFDKVQVKLPKDFNFSREELYDRP